MRRRLLIVKLVLKDFAREVCHGMCEQNNDLGSKEPIVWNNMISLH